METMKKLTEIMSDLELLDDSVTFKVFCYSSHYRIQLDVTNLSKEQIKKILTIESLKNICADNDKVRLNFIILK